MFRDIKVSNIRGLHECILSNLEKINVICGKNNSGKSTLLEGIAGSHRAVGKRFTDDDTSQIYQATKGSMGFGVQNQQLTLIYQNLLQSILKDERLWYSNETDTFVNYIQDAYSQNGQLRSWAFGGGALANIYNSFFPEQTAETILLPPKRFLELTSSVNTGQMLSPEGGGILNYLFYASNQIAPSEDQKVYEQIYAAFTAISSGYRFNILLDKQNTLTLRFAYKNLPWRLAKDCGLGLHDLLINVSSG